MSGRRDVGFKIVRRVLVYSFMTVVIEKDGETRVSVALPTRDSIPNPSSANAAVFD